MDKPLVTVVIPCHNYAAYVTDAIRSVQGQSLNNFECVIVCDACTDNSVEVVLDAIKDDARFRMTIAQNRSLSATRNMGIGLGSAPFLCCLDADDMMGSSEYLETLVSELEKDRTVGIAFTSLRVMDAQGNLGHVPNWPNGWDFDMQCRHINQIPSLCVFRRDMWQRAGGFRPFYKYVEDAEFWTTCGMIGFSAKHVTTAPWFHYRLHDKSASQVHRTGEIPEPDWLEYHPGASDNQRPFAACGNPPRGSWPVRFYHEPDVSIIIPVGKGHEEMVKDALHSVEGQTHRYWECIVVNDTGYNLNLTGFPWVKEHATKELGAGAARNVGLHYAEGDHVVFLDADDMLKPTFLADTLETYQRNGRYVYTDWLTGNQKEGFELRETPEYSLEAIRAKPSLHPITALIPRRWALDVGGFDEELPAMEDVDFFMRLYTHGYCGIRVAKPLLIYNLDTGTRRLMAESAIFGTLFKALLKNRYGKFMEADKMCDCVQPPKGKQPAAPTLENAAEYRETYGEIVLAQLEGKFTPEAPAEFRGPATRVSYGRRAKHDIFYVWQADVDYGDGTFIPVDNYATEPEPTVIPPTPPDLSGNGDHAPNVAYFTEGNVMQFNEQLARQVAGAMGVPAAQLSPAEIIGAADPGIDAPPLVITADEYKAATTEISSPDWLKLHPRQRLPDAPPVTPDDESDTEVEPDDELVHRKVTVGERNDTLPPEQSHGETNEERVAREKKEERNRKDRERRAKKAAKK